ncbi:MAG: histidine kinase [bacterium]|nr:histidine kinase [bacterium]
MKKWKDRFFSMSLFMQFSVSMAAVILVPILIVIAISYRRASTQIRSLTDDMLTDITANISKELDNMTGELEWILLQIAENRNVSEFVEKDLSNYYARYELWRWGKSEIYFRRMNYRFPVLTNIMVIGDNGITCSMNYNANETAGTWSYHTAVLEDLWADLLPTDPVRTVLYRYPQDKHQIPYLLFLKRIPASNIFVSHGTLMLGMRAQDLNQLMGKIDTRGGAIWVADAQGTILYHNDREKIGSDMAEFLSLNPKEGERGSFIQKFGDEKCMFNYHVSSQNGWITVAQMSVAAVNEPISGLRMAFLFSGFFSALLVFGIAYMLIRSILNPIQRLEQGMETVSDGTWKKIEVLEGSPEIIHLTQEYNHMVDKISSLVETVYKVELEKSQYELDKKAAEFQALQSQINPHFLYNTLGVISSYAMIENDTSIEQMTGALSKMLRYAVQDAMESVQLRDEVGHVKNYLRIMTYRYKRMPQIEWNLGDCMEQPILRLTIQPLVENCFLHGFKDGIESGSWIRIEAEIQKECVLVQVTDNGSGVSWLKPGESYDFSGDKKCGTGTQNVHKRIQIAYGKQYGLHMIHAESGGTIMQLKVPVDETRLF